MLKRILIVDDDIEIHNLLQAKLRDFYDLQAVYCSSYLEGMALIAAENFDLYIIDYHLDMEHTGFEILRVLKQKVNIANKVIMFSVIENTELMITAYDLGVSNYLLKPFNIDLFGSVLKKNLRMLGDKVQKVIQRNQLRLELALQSCFELKNDHEREINLTPIEFKILTRLMSAPEQIILKEELAFLGTDHAKAMSDKALEMHIGNMRRKSEVIRKAVHTKRGVGYYWKLREPFSPTSF